MYVVHASLLHVFISCSAGCYIAKERSHNRKYKFINYINDLDKTQRDFAEKQTKQVNNYPWTLTTALVMCILQQQPLHKVIYSYVCCLYYWYMYVAIALSLKLFGPSLIVQKVTKCQKTKYTRNSHKLLVTRNITVL